MNRLLASVPIQWTNPINVVIGVLENSIGWVLATIYSVIPSYGIAIILLTILIRLLLYPIMSRSTRSMRKMQQLQPYVKKLQEKYKSDRQRLSEEQMALFRANNVSPISGCLPLLIQMPILMAMFRVINGGRGNKTVPGTPATTYLPPDSQLAQDLHHANIDNPGAAGFLGMNLALSPLGALKELGWVAAIPYFIVVALIVATGWYQQKQIQARNADSKSQQDIPQAMRTMTRVFPLFFGFISVSLPAGVNIYFLTSNLFQIGQQFLIIRRSRDDDEIVVPKSIESKGAKAGSAKGGAGTKGAGKGGGGRTTPPSGGKTQKASGSKGSGGPTGGRTKKPPPKKVAPKSKKGSGNGGPPGPGTQKPGSSAKKRGQGP